MDSRMSDEHPRIRREKKTIEAMLHIYCNKHHNGRGELCQECNGLLNYAKMRLDKCPFQENKTTCGNCLIHCYQPQMRAKVKAVMRYSGPRMLLHHPILALHHAIDGFKKPKKINKKAH
jgi:hypothetical protein